MHRSYPTQSQTVHLEFYIPESSLEVNYTNQLKQYDGLVGRKSRFAVEVEMRNGKVMRDTTAAVILR